QPGTTAGAVSSPPDHGAFGSSFAYPADGSILTTGSISASAAATSGSAATAATTTQVGTVSVFNGEITATAVAGAARGSTNGRVARGNFKGPALTALTVPAPPVPSPSHAR